MRNRKLAAFLSFFLGMFGVQFFYLGKTVLGLLMLFMTLKLHWNNVTFGISAIMGILFLLMGDQEFGQRYNQKWLRKNPNFDPQNRDSDRRETPRSSRRETRRTESPSMPKPSAVDTQKAAIEAIKQKGIQKYKEYDYEGSMAEFQKVLELNPNEMAAHWNLACCYSLTEQAERAFYHLERAVSLGMKDVEKIRTHEALPFLRIQPEFDDFVKNGYHLPDKNSLTNAILQQQKELIQLRQQGQITEEEYLHRNRTLLFQNDFENVKNADDVA